MRVLLLVVPLLCLLHTSVRAQSPPPCTAALAGQVFPIATDNSQYYRCLPGSFGITLSCPPGRIFSASVSSCIIGSQIVVSTTALPPITTPRPTIVPPVTTKATTSNPIPTAPTPTRGIPTAPTPKPTTTLIPTTSIVTVSPTVTPPSPPTPSTTTLAPTIATNETPDVPGGATDASGVPQPASPNPTPGGDGDTTDASGGISSPPPPNMTPAAVKKGQKGIKKRTTPSSLIKRKTTAKFIKNVKKTAAPKKIRKKQN